VTEGDDYVLNGSKIWTTHAHWANRMFCLVRTGAGVKPQAGITFLLLDMWTAGIRLQPIVTLAGEHELNQVFFDDVRVPKANHLGGENDGWTVAKYLLEFERGGSSAAGLKAGLERLRRFVKIGGTPGSAHVDNIAFLERLTAAEICFEAIEITEHRVMSALASGQNPGPTASMLKVQATEALQRLDELAIEAAGYYGLVKQPIARMPGSNVKPVGPMDALQAMPRYLNNRAATIYGGSNEIQRDLMAKLVLQLQTSEMS
jgi:acyl-CoA dehydrogenase